MYNLIVNPIDVQNMWNTLGMTEILNYLIQSGQFNVSHHKEKLNACRTERSCTLYLDGKKIFFDLWDYSNPTFTYEVFKANYDLILKLQFRKMTWEQIEKERKDNNMFPNLSSTDLKSFFDKIVPWTFFCSRMMKKLIGKEDQIPQIPIERIGFFCGKDWRTRRAMKAKLQKEGIEYLYSDQETNKKPLSEEDFLHRMMSSKYGIVIHGRGGVFCEAKNRREIDYMMLKKPLLLNYKPSYYNPMTEGKHYIYIDPNTDFKNLENMYNIQEIASNGYQWYKENASPEGVVKTFLQIINDKLK